MRKDKGGSELCKHARAATTIHTVFVRYSTLSAVNDVAREVIGLG